MRARTVFLWIVAGAISAAGVIGALAATLLPDGTPFEQLAISLLLVVACGVAAAIVTGVIEKQPRPFVMWSGLAAVGATLALSLLIIWDLFLGLDPDGAIPNISLVMGLVMFFTSIAIYNGMRISKAGPRKIGAISVVFGALASFFALELILNSSLSPWDYGFITRLMLALAILAAAGLSLAPILERLLTERVKDTHDSSFGERTLIALTCPRCKDRQQVRAGKSRCQRCGLRMLIEFDEPRCGCGYLLHGLEADCCPECGEAVPEKDRWPVAARRVTDEPLEAG